MIFKTTLAAIWILAIGLLCVAMEVSQIRIGHRVQQKYQRYDKLFEEVRRLEIRYNRLLSPDLLEKEFNKSQATGIAAMKDKT